MSLFKRLRIFSPSYLSFFSLVSTILLILTTNSFSAQVTLTWNSNSESDLSGYKVYYGNSSRSYSFNVDVGNQTSYAVKGLNEGETYYFAVTAYGFSGNESGYSKEVSYVVASKSGNNLEVLPFTDNQKAPLIKAWSGPVYATKHSRFIHRPNCKELISKTEDLIKFPSIAQALRDGGKPCHKCNP